jgi:nitroreductase
MPAAVTQDALIRQLNWRYATKSFDPARKIAPSDWQTLEQALILSASSFGLQPWKFVVVTNSGVRANLRSAAYGQAQITDASHLVVFTYNKNLGPADVDRFMSRIAEVRGAPIASLEGYKQSILASVNKPREQVQTWASRQAYIALGTFLTSAALLGIDACPMEGFNPAKFDEILGLDKLGFASVALAAAGYRSPDDKYAGAPKVRFSAEEVILHV